MNRTQVAVSESLTVGQSLLRRAWRRMPPWPMWKRQSGVYLLRTWCRWKVYWQLLMTSCSYTSCSPISINSFHMWFNPACDPIRLICGWFSVCSVDTFRRSHICGFEFWAFGSMSFADALSHRVMRAFFRSDKRDSSSFNRSAAQLHPICSPFFVVFIV